MLISEGVTETHNPQGHIMCMALFCSGRLERRRLKALHRILIRGKLHVELPRGTTPQALDDMSHKTASLRLT